MRVYDQDWLSSLEPGILAAKERLAVARRRKAQALTAMDRACARWERRPYDDDLAGDVNEASIEIDLAEEELVFAIAVGEEWALKGP